MDKGELIGVLRANGGLRTPEEVAAFDGALEALAEAGDLTTEDLSDLFMVLDDGCENHEVMFGLLHLVESADLRDLLRAFIKTAPRMAVRASDWVRIFHYRVLNSERARPLFKELLEASDPDSRAFIRGVLAEVAASEGPPLSTRAAFVLGGDGGTA